MGLNVSDNTNHPMRVNEILGVPREAIDAALRSTSDDVKKLVPSDSGASWYAYGGTIARTLVAFYAGRLVGWGLDVSADEATMLGGILAVVLMLVWGTLKVKWAAWRSHQAAQASAAASASATLQAGIATTVVVAPPQQKF